MKKIIISSFLASSLLLATEYKYEVTPIVGYVDTKQHVDIEDHAVFGIGVSRNLDKSIFSQLEIGLLQSASADYDKANSNKDTKITQIFLNGLKDYKMNDSFKLYALAGLGYERISNVQFNNESDPFFNYGVGAAYTFANDLALRLDVRHQLKFDGDKNLLYTLGLAIPFGEKATTKKEDPIIEETKIELDSDNDGVIDSIDKCPNTLKDVIVDSSGCEILDTPANLGIVFETNSDTIKSADISKFEKYATYLKTVSTSKIIIEAHTDSVGNAKYNLDLSQRRAKSAKEQLISMGVSANRIEAIGYGETNPIVTNDTATNREKNRRVTAKIEK